MTNKNISDYTTKELIEELQKREAVQIIEVQPHQNYQISAGNNRIENTGPVVIIAVCD